MFIYKSESSIAHIDGSDGRDTELGLNFWDGRSATSPDTKLYSIAMKFVLFRLSEENEIVAVEKVSQLSYSWIALGRIFFLL